LPIQNLDYPCANRTEDPRYICMDIDPSTTVQSSTSDAMVPITEALKLNTITASADGASLETPAGAVSVGAATKSVTP